MSKIDAKIIAGLALDRSYRSSPTCISPLQSILQNPEIGELENIIGQFTSSGEVSVRQVGYVLQAAIQSHLPDPDPIVWRDLALDMCEQEVRLVDYMYRIGELFDKEKEEQAKENLDGIYSALRAWQGFVGNAVHEMRNTNWIEAKINIDAAYDVSLSTEIDELARRYELPFREAIEENRKDTKRFREEILTYPSKMEIPHDRTETIIRVQSPYLRLWKILRENESDRAVSNAVLYSIEKLGAAIDYLLTTNVEIESASYEIGLAAGHLRRQVDEVTAKAIHQNLREITKELDILFSSLPVKPWPMKGFGSPEVESRFEEEEH